MTESLITYGVFVHEGIVALRRALDGPFIDHDNAWILEWDALISEWCESTTDERAALDGGGIPLPSADARCGVEAEPLAASEEVIEAGDQVGEGDDHVFVRGWAEEYLRARAAMCGVAIERDDASVAAATTRVFAPCSCLMSGGQGAIDFSRTYSMASSVTRSGRIVPLNGGWALTVCPYDMDIGDRYAWSNTWVCALDDAARLRHAFASDDFRTNIVESSPEDLIDALRASGEPTLDALAAEIEMLTK